MDLRLINYVASLAETTQILAKVPNRTDIVRVTNAVLGRTTVIVVSDIEPYELQLPLNVIWAVFDKTSQMYRKIYKRVSKDPNVGMNTQHTWELLTSFSQLWERQYYAVGDEPTGGNIPEATTTIRGTVMLSQEASEVESPIVVTSTDPRNTNARYPLEHNDMHPEKPLRQVATTNMPVTVGDSVEGDLFTPVASSNVLSGNKQLRQSEIMQNDTAYLTAQDPVNLTTAPYRGELLFPEQSLSERLNGVPSSLGKSFTVVVRAFANEDQEQDVILRKFLGYFRPTAVRVNGANVSGNTITLTQPGNYQVEADLTNNPSTATITVRGTLVCIP